MPKKIEKEILMSNFLNFFAYLYEGIKYRFIVDFMNFCNSKCKDKEKNKTYRDYKDLTRGWFKGKNYPNQQNEKLLIEFIISVVAERGIKINENDLVEGIINFNKLFAEIDSERYESQFLLSKAKYLRSLGPKGLFILFNDKIDEFVDKTIAKKKISVLLFIFISLFISSLKFNIEILKAIFGCLCVGYVTFVICISREIKKMNKEVSQKKSG